MERRLVALLGNGVKHILTGLERGLRAVAITGLIVALLVALATEGVGVFLTQSFPTGATHLAAAALAISFGYAAAVTVLIGELLRAFIKAIELIVEEAERIEKKAVEELGVLGRRAEEEVFKLGRTAVTDAGALGRTVAGDAGAIGRTVTGAVGGVIGGAESAVGGAERAVASRLPGHHNSSTAQ